MRMTNASISHNMSGASTCNLQHNMREEDNPKDNIKSEYSDLNIIYKNKSVYDVYDEEFGEVLKEYNKGKRKDRQINDYYEHVLNDKKGSNSKRDIQHQPYQEMIVQIGSWDNYKDDDGNRSNPENWEITKRILDEYARTFEERNPQFKVFSSTMHLDESSPHLHICFVPVGENDVNYGLKKQCSVNKALKQMGYAQYDDKGKFDNQATFKAWKDKDTQFIEDRMQQYGIERTYTGTHENITDYKTYMQDLDELKQEIVYCDEVISDKAKDINDSNAKLLAMNTEIYNLKAHMTTLKAHMDDLKAQDNKMTEITKSKLKKATELLQRIEQIKPIEPLCDYATYVLNRVKKSPKMKEMFESDYAAMKQEKAQQQMQQAKETENTLRKLQALSDSFSNDTQGYDDMQLF